VPSNGLLIEGGATTSSGAGNSGASAYAALIYDVPDGATLGKLNLTVAPNSATTPSTTLELCPLTTQSFQAEEGGPMSDAPSYNCSNNITAAQASSAYVFDVSSLVSSGALAVAILPTSPADRVVLSQPGTKSLDVQPAPDTTVASPPGSGSPSGFGSSWPTDTGTAVGAAPTAPFVSALPLTPSSSAAPEPLLAQPRSTQGAPVANPSTQNSDRALVASASTSTEPRAWVGVIFLVALLLAAALWMASGRSATGRDGGRPIVQR
jgi:hypothetical protein